MDIGSIWSSLYTSQMLGTQMYGLQSDPFQTYGSYADAFQTNPRQYDLQTGALYGNTMQTWQNSGFMSTLNKALTKYTESLGDIDLGEAGVNMDVSTHEGNVVQLGYDRALVYLPEEQKLMIVKTPESGKNAKNVKTSGSAADAKTSGNTAAAGRSREVKAAGTSNIEEKGILVDQRRLRAAAAYRRTKEARKKNSLLL